METLQAWKIRFLYNVRRPIVRVSLAQRYHSPRRREHFLYNDLASSFCTSTGNLLNLKGEIIEIFTKRENVDSPTLQTKN